MRIPKFNILDAGVVAISLLPLLSCYYGLCTTVSVNVASLSLIGLVLYMLGRKLFLQEKYSNFFFVVVAGIMTVAVTFSVITFGVFRQTALGSGFDNIYFVRSHFRPLGFTNNAWSEITLAMIAFSMIAGKLRNILMFLSVVSTLVTFSRGAYISLFLLFLLMLIVNKRRQRVQTLFIAMSSILLVAVFCHKEMLTTLSMNSSYSQKASTEWRLNATESSINLAYKHPLVGYGCGTYTMVSESGDIDDYSSFAPNLPVMLLIENGLLGLGIFTAIVLSFAWRIWKNKSNKHIKEIGCVLFVILLKEMSQATLLHTRCLWLLSLFLLAYVSSLGGEISEMKKGRLLWVLTICLSLVFLNLRSLYNDGRMLSGVIKAGLKQLETGKKISPDNFFVVDNLRKASHKEPFDPYIKYIASEVYIHQGKVKEGVTLLSQLCRDYPRNALFAFSCGNAYYLLNENDKAVSYWREGIVLYPRLLFSKEYFEIQSSAPMLFRSLNKEILKCYPKGELMGAKESAKWGFILNRFGYKNEAIRQIRHSVAELPNLSIPWLILGHREKYNFLTNGLFSNYNDSTSSIDCKTFTLYELLKVSYRLRFATWYADSLDGNPF